MRLLAAWLFAASLCAQPSLDFFRHDRPLLDAHNCYPYQGRWADRIERALKTGFPVAIEQDVTWYGRAAGSQPLRQTGGRRAHPAAALLRACAAAHGERARRQRSRPWPLIVVHFDFKS